MLAYAAWDYVLARLDGNSFVSSDLNKHAASCLLYMLSAGFATRAGDTYTLTDKGEAKAKLLQKYQRAMMKGMPLTKRSSVLPEWFLLKRNNKVVKWYKGYVRSKKLQFVTDRGGIFGGDTLLYRQFVERESLYLHYFPASAELRDAAVTLTTTAYSKKPLVVNPFYYQRSNFSSPGVIWFKDVNRKLYSMSCVYYDYLTSWSSRARYGPKFGVVMLGEEEHFTVECSNAPDRTKLVGDLIAIVAQIQTKESINAEVS